MIRVLVDGVEAVLITEGSVKAIKGGEFIPAVQSDEGPGDNVAHEVKGGKVTDLGDGELVIEITTGS